MWRSMGWLTAVVSVVAAGAAQSSDSTAELSQLRQQLQRGNYAEAVEGYSRLLKQNPPPVAAFVGLARTHRAIGRYSDALAVLDEGVRQHPQQPELLAERADLLYELGRWDDALQDAAKARTLADDHFLARWVQARIYRDQGRRDDAEKEIRWLIRTYTDANAADKPITDPEKLLIVGQAGIENARRKNLPSQFSFVLNEVYRDAFKADPDLWQAEYLSGQLLMEKHNRAEAAEAFDKALTINPRSAEVLAARGRLHWSRLDAAAAERDAEAALKINPHLTEALRLKADLRLYRGDLAGAERLVRVALDLRPREEASYARLAAIAYLARKSDKVAEYESQVKQFCTTPGVFHLELAELLSLSKQYAAAEKHYLEAKELRPDLPAALAGLGLLYMQLGREAEAREVLNDAFKADPFHVRVSNARKVLQHLHDYVDRNTEHFIIRYRKETDQVLAAWLADYLERWYAEYRKLYGESPPNKILVEIITSREMFSGRVLSLPGLPGAAQGASTGPLIVVPSPAADGEYRPYHWAAVVRHELTHAFNLSQTEYRVPIWLTEGLAVRAERSRRLESHLPLLAERYHTGRLYDLSTIARGYHDFADGDTVMLAYLQGWLYVEFLLERHGEAALRELLKSCREGLTLADALQRVCGYDLATFEAKYREYVYQKIRHLPRAETAGTSGRVKLAELEKGYRAKPDDAELAARLAGEYLRRNRLAEGRKLAEAALQRDPGHPYATWVLAQIHLKNKDLPAAILTLEKGVQHYPDDIRLREQLGKLHSIMGHTAPALRVLEPLRQRPGISTDTLMLLAELYELTQRLQDRLAVLTTLAERRIDDLDVRLQLARAYAAAGDHQQTLRWAEQVLFIDVGHAEAQKLYRAALQATGQQKELEQFDRRYR